MIRLMDSALFAAVMDAAVRGTFILLAALAAAALMRRSSASARHLVWLAALTALLLLPAARAFVPEWRVLPAAPVLAAPVAAEAAEQAPVAQPANANTAAAPQSPPAASAPQPAPYRLPVDWKTLALLAWAAGAVLCALRLAYGLVRVRWIQRHAVELTDDAWVRLTDGLARRLGLGRIVRLLREPGATVPMTWGIFHPVILLPGEADGWDDERRRVVLAHELAHVRRWDALTQWIAHLALAVYWFNPLVWVAARKLREEREHACDDAVLEIGTRPAEYADHLLNIVRSLGSSHGPVAALAMARRSQFEGRLLAILDNAVRRNGVSRAAGLATAAAALACLLPLAAMRPADRSAAPAASQAAARQDAPARSAAAETPLGRAVERLGGGGRALEGRREVLETQGQALADARNALVSQPAAAVASSAAARERIVTAMAGKSDVAASAALLQEIDQPQDPGLYAEIIRAAEQIESDSQRRLVLARLLEQTDLSRDNVIAIIAATRTMDSDTERRIVLVGAVGHRAFPASGAVPAPFFETLRGFSSDTEKRIVLAALLERGRLDTASLVSVFRNLETVDTDTERRIVLIAAAQRQRIEGAAREAYIAAARGISSDAEEALALSALVDQASSGAERTSSATTGNRASQTSAARAGREPAQGESVWTATNGYTGTRDGVPRRVRFEVQDAIIGAHQWEVRGFRPGGHLLIEEHADGRTRRVTASCDGAGNPVWSYSVDGQTRPFDAAARRWMESLIREFSR